MKQSRWLSLVLLVILLCGCGKDLMTEQQVRSSDGKALPIEFVMAYPAMLDAEDNPDTRVQKDQLEFEEGDVIHVSATFTLLGGGTLNKYDCLELTGGKWVSREESGTATQPMLWPWDAEEATFHVYYLAHSSGILTEKTERLLDDLRTEADPVYAVAENIPYGGAVKLEFTHLCTQLRISGLKEGETEFWLQKEGLKDAFSLERTDESLNFQFIEASEELRAGQAPRVIGTSDGKGNAVFYLALGDYSNVNITYPYGLSYLTLTDVEGLADLKANTIYTLNIKSGSGNVDEADDEDWWPDPDDDKDDVLLDTDDINGLLQAIHDGKEYVTKNSGTLILAADNSGTYLLRNVDFRNKSFTPQVLPNGTVFDGKYHYIKNVSGSALFSGINGRVSNLGIAGGEVVRTDFNNMGILTPTASVSAVMNNLRVKNISIIHQPSLMEEDVCNIGALVGSNSGTIYEVKLGGKINVEIKSDDAPGRVHVGGLVGQSSGSITNVSLLDDDDPVQVKVVCDCRFREESGQQQIEGDRYVGGLAGLSTGNVNNCRISATVTAENSQGVLMYTGGLIGMLRGSDEGGAAGTATVSLSSSIASGEVTGGLAFPLDDTINGEGRSYTGGLVGYAYSVASITDCKSMGTVHGHDYQSGFHPYENAYYAIGGAFGQIYGANINTTISGVDARSKIHTTLPSQSKPPYFIGLFAGRSDRDYKEGNSNHNTGNYSFIGEIGKIYY